jgi:hypothetical protein
MASWANAPNEILFKIFNHLPSSGVRQCQLTCHGWSEAGQKTLYTVIHLSTANQATSFAHTIVGSPAMPGGHVRELDLGNVFTPHLNLWDSLDLFTKLVENCPNVEVVSLVKPFPSFYARLLYEYYDGHWRSLTSIPHPKAGTDIECYNYVIVALRDTINEITLCDQLTYSTMENVYKVQYNALARRINEFVELKVLKIKTHTNKCLSEFDTMIDDCPDLTSLDVTLFALEPYSPSNQQIDYKEIERNSRICRLDIDAVLHPDTIFKYIYEKFTGLKVLNINPACDKRTLHLMEQSKLTIKDENLVYLCNLIAKLPSYTISNLYIENVVAVLRMIMEKVIDCELKIKYVDEGLMTQEPNARLNLCKKDTRSNPYIELLFPAKDRAQVLHHSQLLEEIGGKLKALTINMKHKCKSVTEIQNSYLLDMVKGYHLDHMFRTCPSLGYLTIEGAHFVACNPNVGINESIETLHLVGCRLSPFTFYQFSVRLPSLKALVIDGSAFPTASTGREKQQNKLLIDMPYSSFEKIHFLSEKIPKEGIYVKVCTMTSEKYFKGSYDGLQLISAKLFNSLQLNVTKRFEIRCRNIKCLSFRKKTF